MFHLELKNRFHNLGFPNSKHKGCVLRRSDRRRLCPLGENYSSPGLECLIFLPGSEEIDLSPPPAHSTSLPGYLLVILQRQGTFHALEPLFRAFLLLETFFHFYLPWKLFFILKLNSSVPSRQNRSFLLHSYFAWHIGSNAALITLLSKFSFIQFLHICTELIHFFFSLLLPP